MNGGESHDIQGGLLHDPQVHRNNKGSPTHQQVDRDPFSHTRSQQQILLVFKLI
jgi:hypothetical protein